MALSDYNDNGIALAECPVCGDDMEYDGVWVCFGCGSSFKAVGEKIEEGGSNGKGNI